jgi:hypothetical protein
MGPPPAPCLGQRFETRILLVFIVFVSRYFYWLHENEKSARKSFQSMGHKESC